MTEAQIEITTGPDRGKQFTLVDELAHIGRHPENQIVLVDPGLVEHQASIVHRGGRYAIFTPVENSVEVDSQIIPADSWVWLPTQARVKLGKRTTFTFTSGSDSHLSETGAIDQVPTEQYLPVVETPPAPTRAPSVRATTSKAAAKRTSARKSAPATGKTAISSSSGKSATPPSKRQVAKFLTDPTGESLLQLGDDGRMPELTLAELSTRKKQDKAKPKKESSPLMLYLALGISLAASMALLFLDLDPSSTTVGERKQAERAIQEFFVDRGGEVAPYQQALREARLATSRGDREQAHEAYRRVLDFLNSEDNNRFKGLTGSVERDEELKQLIAILLTDR